MCEAVVCYAGSVHDTELYWCSGFKLTKGLDECWMWEGIYWTVCVCWGRGEGEGGGGGGGLHACMCVSFVCSTLGGLWEQKHDLRLAILTHTRFC